jgi:hypothetical protein
MRPKTQKRQSQNGKPSLHIWQDHKISGGGQSASAELSVNGYLGLISVEIADFGQGHAGGVVIAAHDGGVVAGLESNENAASASLDAA